MLANILSILLPFFSILVGFIGSYKFLKERFSIQLEPFWTSFIHYISITALLVGLFSIISFDIFGNLLPSILLVICSVVIYPNILKYLNFSSNEGRAKEVRTIIENNLSDYDYIYSILLIVLGFINFIDLVFSFNSMFI